MLRRRGRRPLPRPAVLGPFEYTIAAVVEATDRPDDLSGYRETPARRILLVEGRQACYGDKRAFEAAGNEW